jgi:hypothetical protein
MTRTTRKTQRPLTASDLATKLRLHPSAIAIVDASGGLDRFAVEVNGQRLYTRSALAMVALTVEIGELVYRKRLTRDLAGKILIETQDKVIASFESGEPLSIWWGERDEVELVAAKTAYRAMRRRVA